MFVDDKINFQKFVCVLSLLINSLSIFPWNVAMEGDLIFQEMVVIR